ncbi:MAG: hypothetical protein WCI22_02995 [Actinomycetota bacterium]
MPGNPLTDQNWAPDLANTVERLVGKVRAQATDNAVKASRAIVFGVVAVLGVLTALPLLTILVTRSIQTVLGRVLRTDHATTVYISYYVSGVVFLLVGFWLLSKRHKKAAE